MRYVKCKNSHFLPFSLFLATVTLTVQPHNWAGITTAEITAWGKIKKKKKHKPTDLSLLPPTALALAFSMGELRGLLSSSPPPPPALSARQWQVWEGGGGLYFASGGAGDHAEGYKLAKWWVLMAEKKGCWAQLFASAVCHADTLYCSSQVCGAKMHVALGFCLCYISLLEQQTEQTPADVFANKSDLCFSSFQIETGAKEECGQQTSIRSPMHF